MSVVIPTWNGAELLRQFLPSVWTAAERYCSQTAMPAEVLILDDGSTDGSAEFLQAGGPEAYLPRSRGARGVRLSVFRNEANLGFNESANRGVREASQPLVLLLNNDVEVPVDALGALARHFADPQVFAVHTAVVNAETGELCGTGQLLGFKRGFLRVHRHYTVEPGIDPATALSSAFASGGSAMYRRDTFLGLGGFDPLLSPAYWEDVELSYRAWKRGHTVLYEPGVTVRHRVSSTMRRLPRASLERLQQRNRLLFHWVHLHDRRMLSSHAAWVGLLAVTAPLRLRPRFLQALRDALAALPHVRLRRAEERALAARSDRELLRFFEGFSRQRGINPRSR